MILFILIAAPFIKSILKPEIEFEKNYHKEGWETFYAAIQTYDSNFVCIGECAPFAEPEFDENVWIVKVDGNGEIIWERSFGSSSTSESGSDIIETPNHDLIIVGRNKNRRIDGNNNIFIRRLDSDGELRWQKIYDSGGPFDIALSVTHTFDNNYVVAAKGFNGDINANIWLLNIDPENGEIIWEKNHDLGFENNEERPSKIIQTRDSCFVIVGTTFFPVTDPNSTGEDLFLMKTDIEGNIIWVKTYGNDGYDEGRDILQTDDGGFAIVGQFRKSNDVMSLWLLRTDNNGDTLWTKTYCGDTGEIGTSIVQTDDNGFLMCGTTDSYGNGFWDLWLVRTDSLGDTLWTMPFGWKSGDRGNFLINTFDGGYIAGGMKSDSITSRDGYLIRLGPDDLTSIDNKISSVNNYQLSQNYPNPFNPTTNIVYQIPKEGRVVIKLYDILGREIQSLVNEQKTQGRYEYTFDGSNLSSGVYIYRITSDKFSTSKKFVLMK
ncbi:MAG: T9SS type A sorting domain-containing protein [Melioribacteraceae bacterium]|nr:T9SS type A sorting domain-containing protein [Melioribacteraceae bacterium]MCF8356391.1 T9SS type A sorting domain-containing protein [Melioribacteraceae bacterium]MCF8392252.1 T9SS type A sorting domain-containing protein [Melioribacteraceae bacterium]